MAAAFSPAQTAPVTAGTADPVERWGRHTLEGNQALERGEDTRARQSYSEALAVAEGMMAAAARAHDARAARFGPSLYGISCNDMIALARKQHDAISTGIFLCKLAEGYLAVMENADAPASLRSRCVLHSRVASAALCAYFEERGMWDAAEAYTARANAAFFSARRLQQPAPVEPGPALLEPSPAAARAGSGAPAARIEPRKRQPPPLPANWGQARSEPPPTIWGDAKPAFDLTPPQAAPRKTLRARLLERLARPFRRRSRSSLPPFGSAVRAK